VDEYAADHEDLGMHEQQDAVDWFVVQDWSPDTTFGPWGERGDLDVGDPEGAAQFWEHQSTDFTCAVVSQGMILKEFGVDVSEAQLVYDATVNGWLTQGGTAPEDAGELLNFYGVETHTAYGGTVEDLLDELAHGHKVIVGLDSGEIWGEDSVFEDWIRPGGADHAVVVTGLKMSDPDHPVVVINDPGDLQAGREYPLDQFLDAWADSGRMYVATDDAPPDLAAHSVFGSNYDPEAGMYMDESFWSALLDEARQEIPRALDRVIQGDGTLTTVGAASAKAVFDAWDRMDDAQRNELFLEV